MHNKRGQGLSVNAIILIVLGIVVLAVLVIGFTVGWEKMAPWISGDNVDNIVTSCEVACSTNSVYGYCSVKRELKAEDETLKDVTCYYLNKKQSKYGIKSCSSITTCDVVFVEAVTVDELESKCGESNKGKTVQALIDKKLESFDCPA